MAPTAVAQPPAAAAAAARSNSGLALSSPDGKQPSGECAAVRRASRSLSVKAKAQQFDVAADGGAATLKASGAAANDLLIDKLGVAGLLQQHQSQYQYSQQQQAQTQVNSPNLLGLLGTLQKLLDGGGSAPIVPTNAMPLGAPPNAIATSAAAPTRLEQPTTTGTSLALNQVGNARCAAAENLARSSPQFVALGAPHRT